MKIRWVLVGVMLAATMVVAQQNADERRGELTTDEAALAGQVLLRSAYDLYLLPDQPLRGQRLVLTAELAAQVDPGNVRIADALGNLYAMREEWDLAAEQYRRGLDHSPTDHDLWLTWLTAATKAQNTAEARMAVLDGVVRNDSVPNVIRSEALVRYGQLLLTRAGEDDAADFFKEALKFDPCNREALRGWLATRDDVSTVDQADVRRRMLRACPRDFVVAQEMATLLGSIGLWKQAVEYFDYAWTLYTRQLGDEQPPYLWAVEYCNAMIDAGQLTRAVELFTPMLQDYEGALELRALLIEANNGLNKPQAVRQLVQEVETTYGGAGTPDQAGYDAEMAMFYLVVYPNNRKALQYARLAVADLTDEQAAEPMFQRLLGGAELLAGSEDSGLTRLRAIQAEDIYANVFLADYYFRNGQTEAGQAAILAGAQLGRSGPAFRRLEALARQYDIEIPAMAGAGSIHKMVTANANYVQMGLEPELFVEVSFVAPGATFEVGQPIVIDVELRNIGPIPIPTGREGLFDPKLSLIVTADDAENVPVVITDLPTAAWPTPRYLEPDETMTTQVRLDLGGMGKTLDDHMFTAFTLKVEGVLDALVGGESLRSALPTVTIEPLTIQRRGFAAVEFGEDDARNILAAYEQAMTDLAGLAGSADPNDRLKAAKQVGLLKSALHAATEDPTVLPVTGLPLDSMTESLQAMQLALLADRSPVVRAALLDAIDGEAIDDRRNAVSACFGDPSELVRFRVAELMLNMRRDAATAPMLTQYAEAGNDPLLAELAELILAHHDVLNEAEDTDNVELGDETVLPEDDGTGEPVEGETPVDGAAQPDDADEAGATP